MPAGSGGGRGIGPEGTPGKYPVNGQATGAVAPADAELLAAWVGTWLPEDAEVETEVEATPPATPDAALLTQLHGSVAVVAATAPAVLEGPAELALDEEPGETLVPDTPAGVLVWLSMGGAAT